MENAKLVVKLEGEVHNIDCAANETVLEALLRHGIDAPYGCMAGTCNACQAHTNKGQVEMEFSDALTEEEVTQGEILTCQAKPKVSELEVEYPI